MCTDKTTSWLKFGWFSTFPSVDENCMWMNVAQTRNLLGDEAVDESIRRQITIIEADPSNVYPNVDVVWERFGKVFGALFSLLSYVPVAKDYFYQGFQEFLDDNTQYMEFRTVLPPLCEDLDCTSYTSQIESAKIMKIYRVRMQKKVVTRKFNSLLFF